MSRTPIEPFLWTLFSAGGVLAALFVPVLLFVLAIAPALGWLPAPQYEHALSLASSLLVRLFLIALCSLCLIHAAHRFRYTLYDGLQIKHLNELINLLCYGGAIAGSLWALFLLLTLSGTEKRL